MEYGGGNVVEMPSTRINLPGSVFAHPPNLDLSVVGSRHDEGKGGMEGSKVDSAIVTLKHIFDGGEIVKSIKSTRRGIRCALAKSGNVPYTHSLVL